jgi:hypothetical protein
MLMAPEYIAGPPSSPLPTILNERGTLRKAGSLQLSACQSGSLPHKFRRRRQTEPKNRPPYFPASPDGTLQAIRTPK